MTPFEQEILDGISAIVVGVRILLGTATKPDEETAEQILLSAVILGTPSEFLDKGATHMQMTDIQECVATVHAETIEGNPATLTTAPEWSSSDTAIVLVEPAPDGMTCVIKSPTPAPLGSAVVTCGAMIQGKQVEATLAVDIIASDAAKLSITTSAPTP